MLAISDHMRKDPNKGPIGNYILDLLSNWFYTICILNSIILFIYLGFLCCFQHCTGHITMGSWKGRGNQYIQFVRVLYCKLPTNGKQLPAFPLQAMTGIEPRPQRWEARVLPLCHRGPFEFNNEFFLQIGGTATGTALAPNYATLLLDRFETKALANYPLKLLI